MLLDIQYFLYIISHIQIINGAYNDVTSWEHNIQGTAMKFIVKKQELGYFSHSDQDMGWMTEESGLNLWQDKKFSLCSKTSDQLWGPPSLLYFGLWWQLTSRFHMVPRLRMCGAIPPIYMPSWHNACVSPGTMQLFLIVTKLLC